MIVMFASALAHMLCFGAKLESYRTIGTSMSTLLSAMLGEFDFEVGRYSFCFASTCCYCTFAHSTRCHPASAGLTS